MFFSSKEELKRIHLVTWGKFYVLTTTSLDIAGSLETGAFCLSKLPELKICPELRLGIPDDQPEGLASSPPAVTHHMGKNHVPVEQSTTAKCLMKYGKKLLEIDGTT